MATEQDTLLKSPSGGADSSSGFDTPNLDTPGTDSPPPNNSNNDPAIAPKPGYGATDSKDAKASPPTKLARKAVRVVTDLNTSVDPENPQDPGDSAGPHPVLGWDVTDAPNGHHICFRAAPWRLLARDLRWCIMHAYLLPLMFFPTTYAKTPFRPLAFFGQIVMVLVSLGLTVGMIFSSVIGVPPFVVGAAVVILFIWIAEKAQGAPTRVVTSDEAVGKDTEAWFL